MFKKYNSISFFIFFLMIVIIFLKSIFGAAEINVFSFFFIKIIKTNNYLGFKQQ